MMTFARTDTSLLSRWWWEVDRWMLAALVVLAAFGVVMTLAASPAVAHRIGLDTFYFARRQFFFLPAAVAIMVATSLLGARGLRRAALLCFSASVVLLIATPFVGMEIKGATRWIQFAGLSLQPSEFVKPSFAVLSAWMFAERRLDDHFPGYLISTGLYFMVVALLLAQPDVGMTIVVSAVWAVQFFIAGLPMAWVMMIAMVFICGGVGAYFTFHHVQSRVDRFFDPQATEGYQVMQSFEAFRNGGLLGRGPGEGHVKSVLPDAHADFIFAVTGEEFGLITCLIIVALFAFVVVRGFSRVFRDNDIFAMLAVAGLLVQFALQSIINMASTINLMPPKGMTLPFISYGGSSTLALAFGMGVVLALTRNRPGQEALR
jgi:cell division protein FtsW